MMPRQAARGLVLLAATAALVTQAAGQQVTLDKVVVREKKDGSTKTYDGVLKLGPAGLQVTTEKGDKVIASFSPADVVKVTPGDLPGVDRPTMLGYIASEEKKTKAEYEKARLGYADLLKKATDPRAKRHLEYRVALTAARVADETGDDEGWATLADAAAKGWANFLTDHQTGWEIWPAARAAARLAAETGKYDEAARMWGRMAKNKELPADLKLEAGIQEVDALLRSRAYANAEVSARELAKAAPAGAAKDRLEIYEKAANASAGGDFAGAAKFIEEKLAGTKDPAVRATGHGALGEVYLAAKRPRDAMWAFLWVETVYNADRDEVFKALCRLVDAFKEQADEDRARGYRDKVRRFRATF
jgi:hypothetical protein